MPKGALWIGGFPLLSRMARQKEDYSCGQTVQMPTAMKYPTP
jgi:hypothetical protein